MTRLGNALHAAAIAVLILTAWYGATLYSAMPDTIPIHFNAAGEADGFADTSFGSVFGALTTGAGLVVLMLIINVLVVRHASFGTTERTMYSTLFGYVNVSSSALFAWISIASWNAQPLGPWFMVLVLLGSAPILLIIGLYYHRIMEERKATMPTGDPSQDPQLWRAGMFYKNPHDARLFVPRPPQWGFGSTINTAHPMARLFIVIMVLLIVLPIALMIWL